LYSQASKGKNETGGDYFICAPSGVGYEYPDLFLDTAKDDYVKRTEMYMQKANLSVLNVIVANQSMQNVNYLLESEQISSVFLYPYADYSSLQVIQK
jgi:hypothetical protein